MKRRLLPIAVACLLALPLFVTSSAHGQVEMDRLRFDWNSGFLFTGDLAAADFRFSAFGFGEQAEIVRTGGALDIDPTLWYGIGSTWRLKPRLSLSASWMHSAGRFRLTFPSESLDEGTLDFESTLVSVAEFVLLFSNATETRVARATANALNDIFLLNATYEIPTMNRWIFPYATFGGGLYRLKSDGSVLNLVYEGQPPPDQEALEAAGLTFLEVLGVSQFTVDATDPVISIGGGLRVSLSDRWSADVNVQDIVRIGADHTDIDAASTDEIDELGGEVFQTVFRGNEGAIHNYGVRVGVQYALWPAERPR